MKSFSNTYIFIFSSVMVVVVALVLSFTATMLKPMQKRNVEVEKMRNILSTVNIQSTNENAPELFNTYIVNTYCVNSKGQKLDDVDAFSVDLKKEFAKEVEKRSYPVFEFEKDNQQKFIFPLLGRGLWGPIWGYIALYDDMNTVYGAVFDHKSETPGLGAEISTEEFQQQFRQKNILNSKGELVSINVLKGGADDDSIHGVDAIAGGTITSNGLDQMLKDCLKNYEPFFKKMK